MLGEMAAAIAHEIRQPIAAAMIDATACLRALADNRVDLQEARRAASRMVKEATWADEIIHRTTALYKQETTRRERVDVNAVIREMTVLLQQEAGAPSISVRTELAESVPDVRADRVQLQQVFMNLMLNAIEAMKDTGGELTIRSQVNQEGELLISVSDTGVGLSDGEHRPDLRCLRNHQAARHRYGSCHHPFDRGITWRPSVGNRQHGSRRDVPFHLAQGSRRASRVRPRPVPRVRA